MTTWTDLGEDTFVGLGQRMFGMGENDVPLLEVRELVLNTAPIAEAAPDSSGGA
jgi:protein involved in temperature-dependent protein secretion